MAGKDPLPELRKLREQIRRTQALREERDKLIRVAVEQGYTQQQIASAAGLSQARVHQIL